MIRAGFPKSCLHLEYALVPDLLQNELLSAEAAAQQLRRQTASTGLHYGMLGRLDAPHTTAAEISRLAGTVPAAIAKALGANTYAFVPLALSGARLAGGDAADAAFQAGDRTLIAPVATAALTDKAVCHRNSTVAGAEYVFLSAQLHSDRFALAFELFINIAHDLVDAVGLPKPFVHLLEQQIREQVRGETSIDAWEHRVQAHGLPPETPSPVRTELAQLADPAARLKAAEDHHSAAFADAVAMYLLSLYLDFDYADLREREYPLLAPAALAARLKAVNALYPPNEGYTFSILYRWRG